MKKRFTGRISITLAVWCLCFSWTHAFHRSGGNTAGVRSHNTSTTFVGFPEAFALQSQAGLLVQGKVTDSEGEALPGVTIILKETSLGTTTDVEGNYRLNVPDGQENGTLVFSFVGFETQEVLIGNRASIDVELAISVYSLDEVVVVGYGTQLKKDLTGAISVVKADEISKRQATTIGEALQGLASGVNVRAGGRPGSEARVQIRGLKNLQNATPLYVIDGLITTANRDFNPNDIESIQILKDASAAAIYGSRAANGVIIITTKQGKKGPMQIEFSGKSSVQTTPRYELAETDEFARLNFMAYDNAGAARQALDLSNNTNWQDETFRTGNMQDYNLSFSGGGDHGSYLVSGNYFGNKGTVISTDFERFSLRVNSKGTKGIFSIGENIAISNAMVDEMSGNPYVDVVRLLPTIPVRDPANPGGYGYGHEAKARTFGSNPVALADLVDIKNQNLRIRGNLWSELAPFPFLTYRLNLGYETSADHHTNLRKEGNWTLNQPYDPAIAHENRARYQSKLVENTLTFKKAFDKHALTAVAGQTFQETDYGQIWGTKRNVLTSSTGIYYPVLDQGNEPQTGGYLEEAVVLSYLGRLEYSYDDKYLLNAVIRRDGSSRFGRNYKWGNFPSVSAAWRISEESFFEAPAVDDLKIRASYGTLGSSNIGFWDYLPTINTFSTVVMGRDQHIESGAIQVKLVNDDIRWETLKQLNIGLDAGFMNNQLTVTLEYFSAETEDVLTAMPILMTTGNDQGNPIVNAATLRNTGIEFSIGYREEENPFKYNADINITTLRNEVLDLGYGRNNIFVGNTVTEIGQPIGMWYVLETDGLFQSQADIDSYRTADGETVIQPNAQPGDIRFKDNNGDGQITNDDKKVVGSPWADVELGLNLGASYKNFSVSMNWFGSFGATVYNSFHSLVDRFDDNSNYRKGIQPWTTESPNTDVPRAYYGSTLNSRGDSDRWLESGSFMRLKYISLDYNIPPAIVSKIGFSYARISLSGQNLLTFTKYSGLDPEFNNANNIYERGVEGFAYPNLRTYSLGLQFGF